MWFVRNERIKQSTSTQISHVLLLSKEINESQAVEVKPRETLRGVMLPVETYQTLDIWNTRMGSTLLSCKELLVVFLTSDPSLNCSLITPVIKMK